MKKIIIHLFITLLGVLMSGSLVGIISASKVSANTGSVNTTSKVIGADCVPVNSEGQSLDNIPIQDRKYTCTYKTGIGGFQNMVASMVRYVTYIVVLLGVLAIVCIGVLFIFTGPEDTKGKVALKTWIIGVIIGFLILFFFTSILWILAPWIYQ